MFAEAMRQTLEVQSRAMQHTIETQGRQVSRLAGAEDLLISFIISYITSSSSSYYHYHYHYYHYSFYYYFIIIIYDCMYII